MKELKQAAKNDWALRPTESVFKNRQIGAFKRGANWQSEQDNWILCSERLPELRVKVLLKERYGDNIVIGFLCQAGTSFNWKTDIHYNINFVSHWQPLPKKPLNK